MLKIINSNDDDDTKYIGDDPVRPHIPIQNRIGKNQKIFLLYDGDKIQAITCVSFNNSVPVDEDTLFTDEDDINLVVFYTIWSYVPGKARDLLFGVVDYIKENLPEVKRFVTLSPKTEMAKKFHLRNGAFIFSENETSINYEYNRV